jgi:hypothetical protein
VGGRAEVALDPDFAALVDTDGYQVFLTSYAPVPLYVARRDATGFEVAVVPGERRPDVRGPVTCGWRVVARRRDVEGVRLDIVEEPARPDVLEQLRGAVGAEPPRPSDPAPTGIEVPAVPAAPIMGPAPAPPEIAHVDASELDR